MMKKRISILLLLMLLLSGCKDTVVTVQPQEAVNVTSEKINSASEKISAASEAADAEPVYTGDPFVEINGNVPYFKSSEMTTEAFETYSDLDELGRCGVAYANVCKELMPTENRESISQVKPTGWINKKYDNVDGGYLYNRCHLIGFQLTAENANEKNLITGTRYFNVDGMLPFENMVADYVKETNNHVLYRVTPFYDGDDLVAKGVYMEAKSVEDDGDGILYNVFVFNIQPGITIDYATGDNWLFNQEPAETEAEAEATYILNTKSMKFHKEGCSSVSSMNPNNKEEYTGSRENLIRQGYAPCGSCKP